LRVKFSPVCHSLCLSLFPGVLSEIQLTESGPGIVKPSESLRLSWVLSGFSITTSAYYWHWIHQFEENGLEWMGYIGYHGNTSYAPSLKSRISISRDFRRMSSLQLNGMTPIDTAMYYYARYTVQGNECDPRHKHSSPGGQEEAGRRGWSPVPGAGGEYGREGVSVWFLWFPLTAQNTTFSQGSPTPS
uniref:Immunoglobulin V-set domain-containing protein n=1 Tax=Ornithorhynchus anatinus TaxID=9258 RepID=A0A6I8NUD2_ORNAN